MPPAPPVRYLLDTNILSDLIKNPTGRVAARVRALAPETICTSAVVAGELRYGATKKASAKLSQRVEQLLRTIPVLPLDDAATDAYGTLRTELEHRGQPIGANDLWIAAHALASHCTLVSHNAREFARVATLRVEDWLGD